MLSEDSFPLPEFETFVTTRFDKMFPIDDGFDYEPSPEQSIAAIAKREGRSAEEVAYDQLCKNDSKHTRRMYKEQTSSRKPR